MLNTTARTLLWSKSVTTLYNKLENVKKVQFTLDGLRIVAAIERRNKEGLSFLVFSTSNGDLVRGYAMNVTGSKFYYQSFLNLPDNKVFAIF